MFEGNWLLAIIMQISDDIDIVSVRGAAATRVNENLEESDVWGHQLRF